MSTYVRQSCSCLKASLFTQKCVSLRELVGVHVSYAYPLLFLGVGTCVDRFGAVLTRDAIAHRAWHTLPLEHI